MDEREVERRLHAVLDEGLRADQVDVVTLLEGARVGARRVRRRRRAVAGAVMVVAVAVPVGAAGVWTWQERDDDRVGVAASGPDAQTSVTLTPDPTQTPDPTRPAPPAPEVDPSSLAPQEVAYEVPLDALAAPADAPRDVQTLFDPSQERDVPVVYGQVCDPLHPGTTPIAGALSMLAEDNSNRLDQLQISTNVTGFSRGQGEAAFGEALDDTGRCRWIDEATASSYTDASGRPGFTRTPPRGDEPVPRAQTVVQAGDVLVGVEVADVAGGVDVAALSKSLASLVADRLVEADVPGSAG